MRSFLAIEIPEEIRKMIYKTFARLHRQAAQVKWVEVSQMHLTLQFLGEADELMLQQQVVPRLSPVCEAFKTLHFELKGVGVFPSVQKPRIFWLGLQGEVQNLKRLQLKIENELKALSFYPDKHDFHPHITLGRIKQWEDRNVWQAALEEYEKIDFGSFVATELILFRSELRKEGPVYTPFHKFPFQQS